MIKWEAEINLVNHQLTAYAIVPSEYQKNIRLTQRVSVKFKPGKTRKVADLTGRINRISPIPGQDSTAVYIDFLYPEEVQDLHGCWANIQLIERYDRLFDILFKKTKQTRQ